MIIDLDRPMACVARELNLGAGLPGGWGRKERERTGGGPSADSGTDERVELDRLVDRHGFLADFQ